MEQVNNSKWYPVSKMGYSRDRLSQFPSCYSNNRKAESFEGLSWDTFIWTSCGIKKTIGRVRQRFYWPGLQDDVRRYEQCLMGENYFRKKQAPMQIVHTEIPMERIAADIMDELPETENGNT